jgi:hypothetical protein
MLPARPITGDTLCRVTPLDLIVCTYGTLPNPLTFSMRRLGGGSWVTPNEDPSLVYLDFLGSADSGGTYYYVHVRIGDTLWVETYVGLYWG